MGFFGGGQQITTSTLHFKTTEQSAFSCNLWRELEGTCSHPSYTGALLISAWLRAHFKQTRQIPGISFVISFPRQPTLVGPSRQLWVGQVIFSGRLSEAGVGRAGNGPSYFDSESRAELRGHGQRVSPFHLLIKHANEILTVCSDVLLEGACFGISFWLFLIF